MIFLLLQDIIFTGKLKAIDPLINLKTTFFTVRMLNEILLPHIFLSTWFKMSI